MVLPRAWKERLGALQSTQTLPMETATQEVFEAEISGPVRIEVEGFRPIHSEVAFVDMQPKNGDYEPLIGYLVLEQIPAAVDIIGHRIVPVKHLDLK